MVVSVRVAKQHLEVAYKQLKRKIVEAGIVNEVRRRLAHEKPSERRHREEDAQRRRAEKRELHQNLRLILSRRARGF